MLLFSLEVYSGCRKIEPGNGRDAKIFKSTAFGGCSYFSPIFRLGYSTEFSGYIGLGALIPFDQQTDWEGGFSDKGLAIVVTKYESGEIYDLGYSQRNGVVMFSTGWDAGVSYRKSDKDMKGIYVSYTFVSSITLRYLENNNDTLFSIGFGFKY
jgi:hypothetical protein